MVKSIRVQDFAERKRVRPAEEPENGKVLSVMYINLERNG